MALKPACLQWSDDGALRSLDFGDIYFQPGQGREESLYVFLGQNHLPERFSSLSAGNFRIAELGFGTGLNFLLTAQLWRKTAPLSARLTYVSIEKHPVPVADMKRIFAAWPELREYAEPLLEQYPPMIEGFHHLHFLNDRIHLMLLFGDVADVLPELQGDFDAWYLDGFAPAKNPGMWAENLFPLIAARTAPGGTLSTFSCAGDVRRGLQAAGFSVEKVKGFGAKWEMTVARFPGPVRPRRAGKNNAVVLGAGIAGASAAFALARKGHDVTVMERRPELPAGIPLNPFGIIYPRLTLAPSPMGLFNQHGFCYTRQLIAALKISSWNPCGVVHLDVSEESAQRHQTLAARSAWPEDGLRYEMTASGRGLHQPTAGHLSPIEFCGALLSHPNIKVIYGTTVSSLENLDYDAIVIALGFSTGGFRETAWLPLQSVRGQISGVKENGVSREIKTVICHEGHITPSVGGIHYIGSTFQREPPSVPEVRESDHEENLSKLNAHLPELRLSRSDIVEGLAGYRTATPDKMPLIGACPDHAAYIESFAGLRDGKKEKAEGKFVDRVHLSTGLGSHGFTGAPLAGEIVASRISGDPLPIPLSLMDYLAPERFILRDLKRRKV
ncbi:MAG: bifunctional tRNA (5-methylaminomethyl-2-thiouridine)(34)-methyltransferase MnmD/FAD-dependent 5-carboxymethylaminomethyl-2-thiouridine(34) oxidoreductase MnmC [Pseudomonadota bacterium]